MSDSVTALESAATSSASSIAAKTAIVGGTGLGAPAAIPFMQAHHVWVFSLAEVCQLIATAWIIWQVYVVARAKIAGLKESKQKKEFKGPAIMGGNSGSGPGSNSSGSSSSAGGGSSPREEEQEKQE